MDAQLAERKIAFRLCAENLLNRILYIYVIGNPTRISYYSIYGREHEEAAD